MVQLCDAILNSVKHTINMTLFHVLCDASWHVSVTFTLKININYFFFFQKQTELEHDIILVTFGFLEVCSI